MAKDALDNLLHGLDGDGLALLGRDAVDSDGAAMSEGHALRTVTVVMMRA